MSSGPPEQKTAGLISGGAFITAVGSDTNVSLQITNKGLGQSISGFAESKITMDTLKNHAAFTEPIDTVANMWRVKYGTEWVREKDVYYKDEEFFVFAMRRLHQSGRMEKFMLTDTYDYVVRLLE